MVALMARYPFRDSTTSLVTTLCPTIMPLAEGEKCRGDCHAKQSQSSEEDKPGPALAKAGDGLATKRLAASLQTGLGVRNKANFAGKGQ
jgi:hypothetical protein